MRIYHKITIALLVSILLIETYSLTGNNGLGHYVMTFVYAGFLFACALFFVSLVDKCVFRRKKIRRSKSLETMEKQKQKSQQPHNGLKIVR